MKKLNYLLLLIAFFVIGTGKIMAAEKILTFEGNEVVSNDDDIVVYLVACTNDDFINAATVLTISDPTKLTIATKEIEGIELLAVESMAEDLSETEKLNEIQAVSDNNGKYAITMMKFGTNVFHAPDVPNVEIAKRLRVAKITFKQTENFKSGDNVKVSLSKAKYSRADENHTEVNFDSVGSLNFLKIDEESFVGKSTIDVENTLSSDGKVKVTVNLKNDIDLYGFQIPFNYDKTKLTLTNTKIIKYVLDYRTVITGSNSIGGQLLPIKAGTSQLITFTFEATENFKTGESTDFSTEPSIVKVGQTGNGFIDGSSVVITNGQTSGTTPTIGSISSVSINKDETKSITPVITNANFSDLEVSSSNAEVATVSKETSNSISVYGKAAGTATITLRIKDTDVSTSFTVTVTAGSEPQHECEDLVGSGYKIIFYDADKTTKLVDDVTVNPSANPESLPGWPTAPTKSGYTFVGWFNESEQEVKGFTNITPSEKKDEYGCTIGYNDIKLHAKWEANQTTKHTVTFKANGGTGSDTTQQIEENVSTKLNKNTFTKTGYTFVGWNTNTNGTGTPYEDEEAVKITGNKTLYAQWIINKYTISFNANGGSGSASTQEFEYNVSKKLNKNTFTRTGYTFAGWNTENDGTGTSYEDEESIKWTGNTLNITLYAQWTTATCGETTRGTFKVSFKDEDGTSLNHSQITIDPSSNPRSTSTLPTPTKTGYTFAGWYTSDGEKVTSINDIPVVSSAPSAEQPCYIPSQDQVLYAHWTKTCPAVSDGAGKIEISFETNGGNTLENVNVSTTTSESEINMPIPTKEGYTFDGWYADSSLSTKVDIKTNKSSDLDKLVKTEVKDSDGCSTGTYSTKVYAKWVQNTTPSDNPSTPSTPTSGGDTPSTPSNPNINPNLPAPPSTGGEVSLIAVSVLGGGFIGVRKLGKKKNKVHRI